MPVKYFFLIFNLFYFAEAFAGEIYSQGPTARSLGMGGTYMSFVHGAESLYYNPAMLARVEGFDFVIGQVQGAYSKEAAKLVDQMVNKTSSSYTAADINGLYGLNSFADITARSGIVMPFVGFGVYSTNYALESFNNPPFPTFNANFISDYGYVIGGAIPLGPLTSIGIAGRHIKRWGGTKDILVSDLLGTNDKDLLEKTFQDKGTGHALDLGFVTTFPGTLNTTVSATWQDVGRTSFSQEAGVSSPPSQGDNLTLGVSVQHDLFLIGWTHALEYQYITTPHEDFSKKIHLGTEASFGLFDIRAGFNQGYFTYGGGVDLWLLRADVAYYSVELGSVAGQQKNDRVIYSLTLEIDLDQSFKLKTSEGKNRRLKQRR